jgi:hypothetical protein
VPPDRDRDLTRHDEKLEAALSISPEGRSVVAFSLGPKLGAPAPERSIEDAMMDDHVSCNVIRVVTNLWHLRHSFSK